MDYNNDGKKDLILGEGAGLIRIYINTNTDANPVFGTVAYVKVGSVNKDFGDYSAPYLVDWDNDGLRDEHCGENAGLVNLMIRLSEKRRAIRENMANNKPILRARGCCDSGSFPARMFTLSRSLAIPH